MSDGGGIIETDAHAAMTEFDQRQAAAFRDLESAIVDLQHMTAIMARAIHETFGELVVIGAEETLFTVNQSDRMARQLRENYYAKGWRS